jgi:endonuclease/exonuclease/phosphatase (EEP) superfamily protein YafD
VLRRRIAAVSVVLPAVLTACTASPADEPAGQVTLLQMNLCLSGIAVCIAGSEPADAVAEAISRIRQTRAELVVLDEACSNDAARVASASGLHPTFSVVRSGGAPLACRNPRGRGVFGNAVLTADRPRTVRDEAYRTQDPVEERRVLCVQTRRLTLCGTHLDIRGDRLATVNDAQCAELGTLLRSLSRDRPVVGSGDVNRRPSCAPPGWWTETDRGARQVPGLQQVYGDPGLTHPSAEVQPMSHTDHDALVVRFSLPGSGTG